MFGSPKQPLTNIQIVCLSFWFIHLLLQQLVAIAHLIVFIAPFMYHFPVHAHTCMHGLGPHFPVGIVSILICLNILYSALLAERESNDTVS